ncbi:MAG: hypothetical protein GY696_22100 [Gammaproteobacteria bacterium]|nr:hypothetical protein [Gammaproteobacteria bacterium]
MGSHVCFVGSGGRGGHSPRDDQDLHEKFNGGQHFNHRSEGFSRFADRENVPIPQNQLRFLRHPIRASEVFQPDFSFPRQWRREQGAGLELRGR